ncbi:glyoxalase [Microtetraspora sp. NBRC 13810]|uniref:VOC family protein n=1 Tax=Microtetraspora sp. NBRC 13810 TaxID=3030990 RepID=UPI0024A57107|nr:VOC family protein [Microtetraspora sp. NBRC 13810]GLW10722.1 glyoxalase [Microtetraspora sp. NBRC 13810]
MIAELECVVLDCSDPLRLAGFYQAVIGGVVNQPDARWSLDDDWATLHLSSGLVICFQRVADYRPPRWPDPSRPQQFHLDFGVAELDQAQEQVLSWGATVLDAGSAGRSWRIYADPEGHPFCLVRHRRS